MSTIEGADLKTVLFLCTGNYYRSRHAEEVFNHLAPTAGLAWRAASRGLALDRGIFNVGPMSRATQARLKVLGIPLGPDLRMPAHLTEDHLREATLVVALKEAEHRPMVIERFPAWAERIEYWAVHDVEFAPPEQALPEIEEQVRALTVRLAGASVR
jgi:protein-tyrosine-phosphatase